MSSRIRAFAPLALVLGCAPASPPVTPPAPPVAPTVAGAVGIGELPKVTLEAIDLTKVTTYLREFDSLCAEDGGKLWGASLCGPIVIIDPKSREVVANRRDRDGHLSVTNDPNVFVGHWPTSETIANTGVEWKGMRWTMVMLGSIAEEPKRRQGLFLHEAFHRLQPELKLVPEGNPDTNRHLDERDGRYWLQLEWNALEAALAEGTSARDRKAAITDALTFRAARRARFRDAAPREVGLEINEGLAEYTGEKLAGWSAPEVLGASRRRRSDDRSFVRSFAYVSGPLYGYALDTTGEAWTKRVTSTTDLGDLLADLTKTKALSGSDATKRAEARGGKELAAAEDARDRRQKAEKAEWRRALVDGPVLILDLPDEIRFTFDPRTVHPLSETQTVYGQYSCHASWGTLEVEGGSVLIDRAGRATVSLAGASADSLRGKGWTLAPAPGWVVGPSSRKGDLTLVKQP